MNDKAEIELNLENKISIFRNKSLNLKRKVLEKICDDYKDKLTFTMEEKKKYLNDIEKYFNDKIKEIEDSYKDLSQVKYSHSLILTDVVKNELDEVISKFQEKINQDILMLFEFDYKDFLFNNNSASHYRKSYESKSLHNINNIVLRKVLSTNLGFLYSDNKFNIFYVENEESLLKTNSKIIDINCTQSGNLCYLSVTEDHQFSYNEVDGKKNSLSIICDNFSQKSDFHLITADDNHFYHFIQSSEELLFIKKSTRKSVVLGKIDKNTKKIFLDKSYLYAITNELKIKIYSCFESTILFRCCLLEDKNGLKNNTNLNEIVKNLKDYCRIEITDEYIYIINLKDQNYVKYSQNDLFEGRQILKVIDKVENKWLCYFSCKII